MTTQEKVGQMMKCQLGSSMMRITEVVEPGVIRCTAMDDESNGGRTYKRANGHTYDVVIKTIKGKWEFEWAPNGPGKKRVGPLRFATTKEQEVERLRIKRRRDAFDETAHTLQKWLPDLSEEEAQRFAKKPRMMKEREKLIGLTSGNDFLEWLLTPTTTYYY